MKTRIGLLVACLCWSAWGQQQSAPTSETAHVTNNVVFISPGEQFGINLVGATEGMPLGVSEEPDPKKANLVLRFSQEKGGMMLFTIENRTEHWLTYEAGMKVPARDGFYKTSVVPVGPHLFSLESWPHRIERLALKNFTFTEKPGGKPTKK
jgi:hypothetical protein